MATGIRDFPDVAAAPTKFVVRLPHLGDSCIG